MVILKDANLRQFTAIELYARKNGLGRKLLHELENQFKGQGYNNINLVTSHFQAPDFYKKCGFIPEFMRVNKKTPKLSKTFFVKYFDEENQFQGVLKGRQSSINIYYHNY